MSLFAGKCRMGMGSVHLSDRLVPHRLYNAVSLEWDSDDKIIKSDSAADVVPQHSVLNEREPK